MPIEADSPWLRGHAATNTDYWDAQSGSPMSGTGSEGFACTVHKFSHFEPPTRATFSFWKYATKSQECYPCQGSRKDVLLHPLFQEATDVMKALWWLAPEFIQTRGWQGTARIKDDLLGDGFFFGHFAGAIFVTAPSQKKK